MEDVNIEIAEAVVGTTNEQLSMSEAIDLFFDKVKEPDLEETVINNFLN